LQSIDFRQGLQLQIRENFGGGGSVATGESGRALQSRGDAREGEAPAAPRAAVRASRLRRSFALPTFSRALFCCSTSTSVATSKKV
jgi:hypothetical protein